MNENTLFNTSPSELLEYAALGMLAVHLSTAVIVDYSEEAIGLATHLYVYSNPNRFNELARTQGN